MPYGTVNLRHGVPAGETPVTCTATVGTLAIEFGALSRLTGNPVFEEVAMRALRALWHHRDGRTAPHRIGLDRLRFSFTLRPDKPIERQLCLVVRPLRGACVSCFSVTLMAGTFFSMGLSALAFYHIIRSAFVIS